MPSEIKIVIKNSEKTLTKDHLIYEEFSMSQNDPIIENLIRETIKEFGEEHDSIKIKSLMVIK